MTKTFKVEHKGKQTWVAIRQMPHDPQYKIGSRIPGLGKVVAVGETAVFSYRTWDEEFPLGTEQELRRMGY